MNQKDYQLHQNIKKWNVFFIIVFLLIGYYFFVTLLSSGNLPHDITVLNFVIIALAVFRMIRVFVYDNIFLFLREAFMDKKISHTGSEVIIKFVESENSLKRTLYKLALCPWCIGIWTSMCSFFVFYMYPSSYVLFVILAAASLASFIQIIANAVGWTAEHKKVTTEKLYD